MLDGATILSPSNVECYGWTIFALFLLSVGCYDIPLVICHNSFFLNLHPFTNDECINSTVDDDGCQTPSNLHQLCEEEAAPHSCATRTSDLSAACLADVQTYSLPCQTHHCPSLTPRHQRMVSSHPSVPSASHDGEQSRLSHSQMANGETATSIGESSDPETNPNRPESCHHE